MKNFILVQLFLCLQAFGQKQANIWYFSNGAGLDFNGSCTPSVLTNGQINGFEGCATISDKTSGQLLFYTNSEKVWNRNHQVMPNSNLEQLGSSITQVMILQKPGFDSTYYIFTTQAQSQYVRGLKLAEVNMSLNSSLGGLMFKDSLLCTDTMTEGLTAIRHANGTDIWLIAHKNNSNQFLSYLVTSGGVSLSPVISPIGKRRRLFALGFGDEIGEMKASPDGTRLASVSYLSQHIELFDFNKSTGQVSNLITLPQYATAAQSTSLSTGLYGLSFSPNNRFLYASKAVLNSPAHIFQYDVSSNDSAMINNSMVSVFTSTSESVYSMKLGPDKRIYVGRLASSLYIGVINFPDSAGINCNYINNGIYLNGKNADWGLNNLMEYGDYCTASIATGLVENKQANSGVTIYPNPMTGSGTLHFENPNKQACHLSVINALGQTVLDKDLTEEEITLDKKELGAGLFFFKLQSGPQMLSTGKFILD